MTRNDGSTRLLKRSRWFRLAPALALVLAVAMVPGIALARADGADPAVGSSDPGASETGRWIIEFDSPSLSTYAGEIRGLAATSPEATGAEQLDVDSAASRAYLDHVGEEQMSFARQAESTLGRNVSIEHEYRHVLNAVAIEASGAEAATLAALTGVHAVYPEQVRQLSTDVSQDIINTPVVWDGQTGSGAATRGEGVIVGVLDSGINPDHPSFAEVDGEGYRHENPLGAETYLGVCDPQDESQPDEQICNDKLIGAYAFDYRSNSAIDSDGHGSHVASTAAGDVHDAVVAIDGGHVTRTLSGVAPHANIIAYRVCAGDCMTTGILAGIDQAVADGVDVLNFSISGTDEPWADPVELAFLEASAAGVFTAAAAGNDGPGASTTAHASPWVTATAASTTPRVFAHTVDVVSSGSDLTGIGASAGNGPAVTEPIEAPIIDTDSLGAPLACTGLDTGTLEGAVALVERGDCEFRVKVAAAAAAGAVAVVVSDTALGPPTLMGGLEDSTVPGLMIDQASGAALRQQIDADGGQVTVRINAGIDAVSDPKWGNVMADFSSRGPSQYDLVSPTLTAPGVNILAATAGGQDAYELMQGTSMASPHVAGAGALMTALHPEWSPAETRSVLAATADSDALVNHDGSGQADTFDQGSGLLDLRTASRAGLVLEETYDRFQAADPAAGGEPSALNLPALVNQDCAASCSWTRAVTAVADVSVGYQVEAASADGLDVTAEPSSFTLAPGQTQQITFTTSSAGAVAGEWAFGDVLMTTDATHADGSPVSDLHLPVAVVPAAAEITVEPGDIDVQQRPDAVTDHVLTIGSSGGQDLTWSVRDGNEGTGGIAARPTVGGTSITTVAPERATQAESSFATAGSSLRAATGAADASYSATSAPAPVAEDDPDAVTLTHSDSQEIVMNNTIACSADGLTADNGYLRTFTLADFGVLGDFAVNEVSFGVEMVLKAPITVTVRLYTLDSEPFVYANMTEIGQADVTLEEQQLQLVSVPVDTVVPAGSTLVVEIDAPDTRTTSGFFAGSNKAGESAPSYIRSNECGLPEPTPLADIGYPDTHVVMNVTGTAEDTSAGLPEWITVEPSSGTVAPGERQEVTVTVDSSGLAAGDQLHASLVLQTNDPARPNVVVPVTLAISGDGGGPDPGAASQDIVVSVPEDGGGQPGSLVLSVDADDRTVYMAEMVPSGDRLTADGTLRPVTISDSRAADPGWDASAQVSEFSSATSSFGGSYLGWSPLVDSVTDGQTVLPGEEIAPGFPTGDGLSVPRSLASADAGAGRGTAQLGADLQVQVAMDTEVGEYHAVLTLTAL